MPKLIVDITELFEHCRALNLVRTQSDFSKLCGRTPHWFSSCKSQNLPLSTEALLTLSFRIGRTAKSSFPKHLRVHTNELNRIIAAALTDRMIEN